MGTDGLVNITKKGGKTEKKGERECLGLLTLFKKGRNREEVVEQIRFFTDILNKTISPMPLFL
jgi:hypothetical protein